MLCLFSLCVLDGEGVCFHIEGMDTRQNSVDSSLIQGDVMIPVQVIISFTINFWSYLSLNHAYAPTPPPLQKKKKKKKKDW